MFSRITERTLQLAAEKKFGEGSVVTVTIDRDVPVRTPEGERVLKEGDVVCFPRGKAGAHQVWNGSDSPIRVLMLSTLVVPDIIEYLDTGKVGARSVAGEPIMFSRPGPELDYWEGEE
mgnify:CR=1 FL=1